jgi:Methyltransferase domain
MELGILHGGSVAFITLLANPEKYVATDLLPGSSEQFDAWLESYDEVVRPYYGVDYADAAANRGILAKEFAGKPLDLVIDDGSHLLEPTRSSFNALFPALRSGGIYVIEDWARDHHIERRMAEDPAVGDHVHREIARQPDLADRVSLTRLVFEIGLASAYTDFVDEIQIHDSWVSVTRGFDKLNPRDFDIAECHLNLGRRVLGDQPISG